MNGFRATASVIRLNTRLFLNCTEGVTDSLAVERPTDATNSLAFIACHVIDSRYFMAGFLGLELENPLTDLLGSARSVEDVRELPGIARIRDWWSAVSKEVEACVADLRSEDLVRASPQRFPVDDSTVGGAVAFLVQHESYHIGQMALLRKYLGYPAMTYR